MVKAFGDAVSALDKAAVKDHGATLDDTVVNPKKRKKHRQQRPSDMPTRPLSAYNFFFREERVRWLEEREKEVDSLKKKHGRLFYAMGKELGKRWKELKEDKRARYHKMANEDSNRYRLEMETYNQKVAERSGLHRERTIPTGQNSLQEDSNIPNQNSNRGVSTTLGAAEMLLAQLSQGTREAAATYMAAGSASPLCYRGQAQVSLASSSRDGLSVGLELRGGTTCTNPCYYNEVYSGDATSMLSLLQDQQRFHLHQLRDHQASSSSDLLALLLIGRTRQQASGQQVSGLPVLGCNFKQD